MASAVVQIQNLHMVFDGKAAVDNVSFTVDAGETFGLLGSNGSGKTTTLRALLGIYQPTAGTVYIDGKPYRPQDGATLGYLPEERGLYKKENVLETMVYFGRLKGMSRQAAKKWSRRYLERVDLLEKTNTPLEKLSGGQQQKVQLGVTIMNNPALLILDEPTKGFDPVNRRLLNDLIAEQKKRGATVILVTHDMAEVERLCDRIILLKNGATRAYGTVSEVQEQFGERRVQLRYRGELPPVDGYDIEHLGSGKARILLQEAADPSALLAQLVRAGATVESFLPSRTSLEDIFVRLYGEHRSDTQVMQEV